MIIRLLKKWLPQGLKHQIIKARAQWHYCSVWFFSRTRFLSSVYYCFFSRQFDREHHGVLAGRLAFMTHHGLNGNSHTLLRRNIHRIEKGLIMQPRKTIFALDYIAETVGAYRQASQNIHHDELELKWARDVLTAYFAAVDISLLPHHLKRAFETAKEADLGLRQEITPAHIPYQFQQKVKTTISTDDFSTLCMQRRAVRWFEHRLVERSLLEQAITIASMAPSACNRQPYRFYIADEFQLAQKIMETPMGTKGFAHNVPCAIVVTADLAHYPAERDRHLIYIDSTLATMQLMLALETQGLSSCPINWPDIEEKEQQLQQLLQLPDTVRPIMLLAVGYGEPDGQIPYSQKKSAEQLIYYVNEKVNVLEKNHENRN